MTFISLTLRLAPVSLLVSAPAALLAALLVVAVVPVAVRLRASAVATLASVTVAVRRRRPVTVGSRTALGRGHLRLHGDLCDHCDFSDFGDLWRHLRQQNVEKE